MIKGYFYDKKNIVIIAVLPTSNNREKPSRISKDTGVEAAPKLSSGDDLMLNDSMNDIGLICGSKKATQLGNYACFRATVNQSLNGSRIIGLKDCLMSTQITHSTNTSFMMELTSIKTVV